MHHETARIQRANTNKGGHQTVKPIRMSEESEEIHLFGTAIRLPTFRLKSRKASLLGYQIDRDVTEYEGDAVVVGCTQPDAPNEWHIDDAALIGNHPNWGKKWPKTMFLPDTSGLLPRRITMPTSQDDLLQLITYVDGLKDVETSLSAVKDTLVEYQEEMQDRIDFARARPFADYGMYLIMYKRVTQDNKDNDEDSDREEWGEAKDKDGVEYDALIMPDLIDMVVKTAIYDEKKHIVGRNKPMSPLNFRKLHDEVALLQLYNNEMTYDVTRTFLIHTDDQKKTHKPPQSFFADQTIKYFGSYDLLMKLAFVNVLGLPQRGSRVTQSVIDKSPSIRELMQGDKLVYPNFLQNKQERDREPTTQDTGKRYKHDK